MIKKESYFELKKEREMICSDLDLFRINTFHVLNISEKIEKSKIVSDIIKKIKKFKELAEKDIEEIENEKTMEERFSKAKKQIYDYYFSPSFSGKFDDKTGDFNLLVDGFLIDNFVNKKEKVEKEIIKKKKKKIKKEIEKITSEINEKILKDPLFEKEIIKLKKITIEDRLFKEKKRRREKYKGKEKDIQKKIGESI